MISLGKSVSDIASGNEIKLCGSGHLFKNLLLYINTKLLIIIYTEAGLFLCQLPRHIPFRFHFQKQSPVAMIRSL